MKKTSFKKFISLVLAISVLLSIAVMAISVSANATYTEITKNTDFVHNGITYRFDVRDGNTDSYARINADGSIEMKYSYGDILWFPDIKMTDTSAMHAEVTSIAHDSDSSGMSNTFMGVVYGATEKADGSFDTGIAGILRTAGRARITVISRDNLTNKTGGDHGNGGGTKIYNEGNFKDHENYASVKSSSNDWGFNKTIKFDVSRVDNTVTFAMSSAAGEFFTTSYDNGSYAYAGAIGWTSVWANNASYGDGGLAGIVKYIQSKGMTAGIWLELEACEPNRVLYKRSCIIHRNGEVVNPSRAHINFASKDARDYLMDIIDRFYAIWSQPYSVLS